MDIDLELYDGKSFKDLCKDIVSNQSNRKEQIEILISDLRPMIKTMNDALQVVPLIKQYIDAGIQNDEALIKLAQLCQRILSAQANSEGGGGSLGLTEDEKQELMASINNIANSAPSMPVAKVSKDN